MTPALLGSMPITLFYAITFSSYAATAAYVATRGRGVGRLRERSDMHALRARAAQRCYQRICAADRGLPTMSSLLPTRERRHADAYACPRR